MKDYLEEKINRIVNGRLTGDQIEDLIGFFRQAMANDMDHDDDDFFKKIAYEMTGEVKELAMLIIDFKRDLKSKIHPEIMELAIEYIPQATDQLEGIIETTAMAANKIMDNLENMQGQTNKMEEIFASLKDGKIQILGEKKGLDVQIDAQTLRTIFPLIDYMDSSIHNYRSLISDSILQMSFQDLTGQRIKRTMNLISQMEEKLKNMIISFGIRLSEKEKNPDISNEELQRTVEEKVGELAGPQRKGQGLDQAEIDELLANF